MEIDKSLKRTFEIFLDGDIPEENINKKIKTNKIDKENKGNKGNKGDKEMDEYLNDLDLIIMKLDSIKIKDEEKDEKNKLLNILLKIVALIGRDKLIPNKEENNRREEEDKLDDDTYELYYS